MPVPQWLLNLSASVDVVELVSCDLAFATARPTASVRIRDATAALALTPRTVGAELEFAEHAVADINVVPFSGTLEAL